MSTDAIVLLKEDHNRVEQLFKKLEQAGDRAFATKRKLVDSVVEEEEQVWFPQVRKAMGRKQLRELGARTAEEMPGAPRDPLAPQSATA